MPPYSLGFIMKSLRISCQLFLYHTKDIRQKGITVPFLLMSGDDDCLLEQKAKRCGGVFCSKVDYDLIEKIKSIDSH